MTGRMAQGPAQRACKSVGNALFCRISFGVGCFFGFFFLLLIAFLRIVFCEKTLLLEVMITRKGLLENACWAYSFASQSTAVRKKDCFFWIPFLQVL